MGRQNARLWHDGKDHKDFFKQPVIGEWHMHWKIYKGSNLIWEKLPPNILLRAYKEEGTSTRTRIYESVTGKKLSYLGDFRHTGGYFIRLVKGFCKVGKRVYSLSLDSGAGGLTNRRIVYTENGYAWKRLELKNFSHKYAVEINNFNNKLLICTESEVGTYDYETDEFDIIYKTEKLETIEDDYYDSATNITACTNDTIVIGTVHHTFGNRLLTIKNGGLVHAENEGQYRRHRDIKVYKDTFFCATERDTLISKDGVEWTKDPQGTYRFEVHNDKLYYVYFSQFFYYIGYYDSGIFINTSQQFYGSIFLSDGNYVYLLNSDSYLVRTKDPVVQSQYNTDIVCNDSGLDWRVGIYIENWED